LSNGIYELTSFDLNNHFDDKMVVIEKYNPEKVFSVVHIDGKSKNYMVKRFVFESAAIGKQTSIISDENGSKLVLISGAAQALVNVVQTKGKEQTPETIEVDLSAVIDVKGMKAMGNRLSQQPIKTVELLAEIEAPEEEVIEDEADADDSSDINDDPDSEIDQPVKKASTDKSVKSPEQSVESADDSIAEHNKNVDLEITNPDDIDMDDDGQLGLF
jgi:topoisomerase IV subunit A